MSARSGTCARALCILVLLTPPAAAEAPADEADRGELTLPRTFGRVWYRTPEKRLPVSGDLTITEEGLDFNAPKLALHVPMQRIRILSLGKVKGDVNTDWVVLGVGGSRPTEILAFRDAKRLGYGPRTRAIYEDLRSAFAHVSAAQFQAPEGFMPYTQIDAQCALAIPDGWSVYLESLVYVGEQAPWGTIVFSSKPIQRVEIAGEGDLRLEKDASVLEDVLGGRTEAFSIVRTEAAKSLSCDGFTEKGKKRVLEQITQDVLFAAPNEILEPASASPAEVGGCHGLRVRGRSRTPDGKEIVLDAYAVAHRDTLFVFALRALEEHYEAFRKPFDTTLSTVQFSVAR